jgi:hypothetical protein
VAADTEPANRKAPIMATVEAPALDFSTVDAAIAQVKDNQTRYLATAHSADMLALLDAAEKLRAALDGATYYTGHVFCLEQECDHMPDGFELGDGVMCPMVEVRVATKTDAIRLHRIGDRLKDFQADGADAEDMRTELDAIRAIFNGEHDGDDI